jgi:uncharacterized protein (DUF885 family)
MVSPIFAHASRHVDLVAAHDPLLATFSGIAGHDDRLPTLDPDWFAAGAELDRVALAELAQLPETDDADRLAREVMAERLGVALDTYEAGVWRADLNVIASPLQSLVEVIDLADTSTEAGRLDLAARLEALPGALSGWRATLESGRGSNQTVAIRQVRRCADQTRRRASHFVEVVAPLLDDSALGTRLDQAATAAASAYAEFGRWLEDEYAPRAREDDGVGIDRYRLAQRTFLGADPDPADSYAYGWAEVHRLHTEMVAVAEQILPGATLAEVLDHVEARSDFAVYGVEAFRDWAQGHVDSMIEIFGREQFDLPPALRVCEVKVSPAGGSTAAHYTGPSEDGTRPGIYWQPDLERERYPLWNQVTTANHEAVPGHHLQIAQVVLGGAPLSRYQKMLCWISGHGEGWALYAERLCAELGLLDRPEATLGYLAAAQLRAVRVVIDIGLHCGYRLPADAPVHPGEAWTWEVAFDLARAMTGESEQELASEIDRYCGWPGQAPSYKLGEREWLAAREDARRAAGDAFDLKQFHTQALNLGPLGLDILRRSVATV